MDKYAFPICLAALILVNLASLAPPMRKNRGGRKVMTAGGWIVYLIFTFGAIWALGYSALTGTYEFRKSIFWLVGVFGVIAAIRIGWGLGALFHIISLSGEEIERTVMLRREVDRLMRAVANEEARRMESEVALKAEIADLRKAAGEAFRRLQPEKEPQDGRADEVDSAPDPSLLLRESSAKIPVELLKKEVEEAESEPEESGEEDSDNDIPEIMKEDGENDS